MPRYPRGARRPRKPFKGKVGLPGVVGDPSVSRICGRPGFAKKSRNQKNADKNRNNPTSAETKFQDILEGLNLRFQRQYTLRGLEKCYILDFFLFDSDTAVEIDGPYHNTPAQRKKDRSKEKECKRQGITLLRYTNNDVFYRSTNVRKDLLERTGPVTCKSRHFARRQNPATRKVQFSNFDIALAALRKSGGVLRPNGHKKWVIESK